MHEQQRCTDAGKQKGADFASLPLFNKLISIA